MPRKYSRRRRTKRRKSKKIRGGVTVRAQDLTRLPSDVFGEIREMHPLLTPKLTNTTIIRAVRDYLAGGARKQRIREKYGEISNWDVSKVTSMRSMFAHARSFNQPLNNWDVSKVTNMGDMFAGASSFNQPLNNWNVSNVTYMDSMFLDARSFNQPLNNWNVSKVTNMEAMFWGATSFNQPLHAPWYAVEQSDSE